VVDPLKTYKRADAKIVVTNDDGSQVGLFGVGDMLQMWGILPKGARWSAWLGAGVYGVAVVVLSGR
jgi:hypothetical protein